MFGKRFEKELNLVHRALRSEEGEKELREYLIPFINRIVSEYIVENNIIDIPKADLTRAGWTHLSMAVKHYSGRADLMLRGKNDVFYFTTYFNWYVRQGIKEYIKTLKK